MSRPSKMTGLLVEVIQDRLGEFGVKDRTPLIDDIVEDYRKAANIRSVEAHRIVPRRLDRALRVFEDDGWYGTKATVHFVDRYKDAEPDHPLTDVEIMRSVAGGGSGLAVYAIHFCSADDCVLFMEARIRGFGVSEGLRREQMRRIGGVSEAGQLTPDAVETIARESDLTPGKDLRRVYRVAAKAQQLRITP